MTFRDLTEFVEDGGLEVKVGAKLYRIPSPDARTGLRLLAYYNLGLKAAGGQDLGEEDLAGLKLGDDDERELYEMSLGPVYRQLIDDGQPWTAVQRLGQYAFLYFASDPATADGVVERMSAQGEAEGPNRAARRASRTTSSRSGRSTPKAASPAGTTSRRNTSRRGVA